MVLLEWSFQGPDMFVSIGHGIFLCGLRFPYKGADVALVFCDSCFVCSVVDFCRTRVSWLVVQTRLLIGVLLQVPKLSLILSFCAASEIMPSQCSPGLLCGGAIFLRKRNACVENILFRDLARAGGPF